MLGAVCTTIKVREGHPEFWTLHKERLQYFAGVLNRAVDIVQLDLDIHQVAGELHHGVIRIELDHIGQTAFTPRSLPTNDPLSWHVVHSERTRRQATIKWLNRAVWDAQKNQGNVDVLLLLDEYNRYLECCIGNVFVYRPREQKWYTPHLSLPLLPGIMRSVLLANAYSMGETIVETGLTHEQTDEIWMCNAIRGLCSLNGARPMPKWSTIQSNSTLEVRALEHFRNTLSQL